MRTANYSLFAKCLSINLTVLGTLVSTSEGQPNPPDRVETIPCAIRLFADSGPGAQGRTTASAACCKVETGNAVYIVTAYHVVYKKPVLKLELRLGSTGNFGVFDITQFVEPRFFVDPTSDLAVFRVDPNQVGRLADEFGIRPAVILTTDLGRGISVAAVGNPEQEIEVGGKPRNVADPGVGIRAVEKAGTAFPQFVQGDAKETYLMQLTSLFVRPGFSGGPILYGTDLVNQGRLAGIILGGQPSRANVPGKIVFGLPASRILVGVTEFQRTNGRSRVTAFPPADWKPKLFEDGFSRQGGQVFSGKSFTARDFENLQPDQVIFEGATFKKSDAGQKCTFTDITFPNGIVFQGATFDTCTFQNVNFERVSLSGVTFNACEFAGPIGTLKPLLSHSLKFVNCQVSIPQLGLHDPDDWPGTVSFDEETRLRSTGLNLPPLTSRRFPNRSAPIALVADQQAVPNALDRFRISFDVTGMFPVLIPVVAFVQQGTTPTSSQAPTSQPPARPDVIVSVRIDRTNDEDRFQIPPFPFPKSTERRSQVRLLEELSKVRVAQSGANASNEAGALIRMSELCLAEANGLAQDQRLLGQLFTHRYNKTLLARAEAQLNSLTDVQLLPWEQGVRDSVKLSLTKVRDSTNGLPVAALGDAMAEDIRIRDEQMLNLQLSLSKQQETIDQLRKEMRTHSHKADTIHTTHVHCSCHSSHERSCLGWIFGH